jgi:hypothetical protein
MFANLVTATPVPLTGDTMPRPAAHLAVPPETAAETAAGAAGYAS